MDSPSRYCPTPGSMSSHPPQSGSPQTIPIMHQPNQNDGQQQHSHLGHQHPGYYGHTNHSHNYPLQQHSAYYQHPTVPPPVSGYYSPLQQQQQNNHVPITTASAPPPVAHNPYHPQSQQGAPPDWQQQHYYHPQQQPHLQQQHPQSVYPQQSHSPYGYLQNPQQQSLATAQLVQQPVVHDNHMQQQPSQHALMNLSRFVSQSPSPSPSSSNHGQLINGSNLNPPESQSPTRSITSPSSSCSTNGQMIPVRLQMGKGQARTKANMRKLAMLEQQNSSNSSVQQFAAISDGPNKKASRAKTPKNKKSLENGESMFADIKTPESTIPEGDSLLGGQSPDKKRRGRKPKNSTSPEDHPVEKKKRQSKKSMGVQYSVPMNGDFVPVKTPRKPRKKKEVLPLPFPINPMESINAPSFQDLDNNMTFFQGEKPKSKSPRSRNKRKKSENLVLETMPVTNSPEKEYTLQIPEINDIPTNTVKIVQTIKLPKLEKKGKIITSNSMQDRKAVLEEEVAQALLDLQEGKTGPPSPLKIVEAPTTMLELYENTNEVHGIRVKKSLNVIDKKPITPKVKTPRVNKKRKSAVDPQQPEPTEPKRKKSGEKKEKPDSSPAGKRKKSTEVKESPAAAKKRKLSEAKEQSLGVKQKTTPKAKKARVSRSPKKIPIFPLPETTSVMPFQDQEPITSAEELPKNGKAKKNKKVARLSGNMNPGANNVASNTTPAFGITIAPLFSNGDSGSTVAKVTIITPPHVKVPPVPVKISAPNPIKAEQSALSFVSNQIPTRATTPAKSVTPQVKATALTPVKTSPVKATTPISVKTSPAKATKTSSPTQGKDKVSTTGKAATPIASKSTTLPTLDVETPIYPDVPNLVDSTPPIKTKATKSNSAKKTANAKAPRVNTKKKVGTSKAKSTTKSLPRIKVLGKEEPIIPPKRKAKNSPKGKATPNNLAKAMSPAPTKSPTTVSQKMSKTPPTAPSTPPTISKTATINIAKNNLMVKLSTTVLDRDNEVTNGAQPLTSKRRSSASSKNASATPISATAPASSTVAPIICPSMEPESNYLPQPDLPFVPLPVVSSITATASKIIKKRNSKSATTSASFNSADAIISSVSSAGTHLPDLEPVVVVTKTVVPKTNAKNSGSQNQANGTKISLESSLIKDLPAVQIKQEKIDPPKVRTRRPRRKMSPVIPKPEPFQLTAKPKPHVPTVFVKQSPLGNTAKGNAEKEKHVGPSLRVIDGKVKFYRGSDEEDNETEPKLPREKVPVEFDETVPWTCVFCQLGPQVERLGDLFGPYYVKQDEKKGKIPGKRETWVHEGYFYHYINNDDNGELNILKHNLNLSLCFHFGEECAVWAHKVLMIGTTLRNLDEAVYFGDREKCNICGLIGATVGCLKRGCTKAVHVPCAKTNSWKLDVQTMQSFCPDHI